MAGPRFSATVRACTGFILGRAKSVPADLFERVSSTARSAALDIRELTAAVGGVDSS
jgi:hypothetical protein